MAVTVTLTDFVYDGTVPAPLSLDDVDINFFDTMPYTFGSFTQPYLYGIAENSLAPVSLQDAFQITLNYGFGPERLLSADASFYATGLPDPVSPQNYINEAPAWIDAAGDAVVTRFSMTSNISDTPYAIIIAFDGDGPTVREMVEDWTEEDLRALNPVVNGEQIGTPGGGNGGGGGGTGGGTDTDWSGTAKDDTYKGKARDEVLDGKGGNDKIFGGGGSDVITGGTGNDKLYGGAGRDALFGGDGKDRLFGGADDDAMAGGKGNDILKGGGGDDFIEGVSGRNKIAGGGGDDEIAGGNRTDIVKGGGGDDLIYGYGGNDKLYGGSGDDTILGGYGQDYFDGGAGDDRMTGAGTFSDSAGDDIYIGFAGLVDLFIFDAKKAGGDDQVYFRDAEGTSPADIMEFRGFGLTADDDDLSLSGKRAAMEEAGFTFDESDPERLVLEYDGGSITFQTPAAGADAFLDQFVFG